MSHFKFFELYVHTEPEGPTHSDIYTYIRHSLIEVANFLFPQIN